MAEHPELSAQERAGKAFPVSWDQFHRDCRALTWRLNEVGPFHAVIAITRGGLVPAAIMSIALAATTSSSVLRFTGRDTPSTRCAISMKWCAGLPKMRSL